MHSDRSGLVARVKQITNGLRGSNHKSLQPNEQILVLRIPKSTVFEHPNPQASTSDPSPPLKAPSQLKLDRNGRLNAQELESHAIDVSFVCAIDQEVEILSVGLSSDGKYLAGSMRSNGKAFICEKQTWLALFCSTLVN